MSPEADPWAKKSSSGASAADLRRAAGFTRGQVNVVNRLHSAASIQTNTALSDGTQQTSMGVMRVLATADARDLRLVFSNYYYGIDGPNTIFVRAAIEVENTVGTGADNFTYPVTFNGATEGTIAAGGILVSDPVPIQVAKGDTLSLRTFVRVGTLGEKWPQTGNYRHLLQGDNVVPGGTDQTAATTQTLTGVNASANLIRDFAPIAVLGTVAPGTPCFGLWGDSVTVGFNETDAIQRGWAEKALNDQYPYFQLSRHSESIQQMLPGVVATFTPKGYLHKWRFAPALTHVFSTYGVNDTGGTDPQATIQANLLANWVALAALDLKVWAWTMPPRTTSTDGWVTTGNQTITVANNANAKRIAINDWVRDGAPILAGVAVAAGSNTPGTLRAGQTGHPLRGYIETADAVETARNSGIWKAANTTDGLHPEPAAHVAMAAMVNVANVLAS
ncbi:MAG: hypothetical protein ACJ768_09360 [Gaiellaceae bacterium]